MIEKNDCIACYLKDRGLLAVGHDESIIRLAWRIDERERGMKFPEARLEQAIIAEFNRNTHLGLVFNLEP